MKLLYKFLKIRNCPICNNPPDTAYVTAIGDHKALTYGVECDGKFSIQCDNCCYCIAYRHKWFSIIIWNRLKLDAIKYMRVYKKPTLEFNIEKILKAIEEK